MKELVITSFKRWVIVCLVLCFPGVQLYAQNVVNTVRSEQNKTITGVNVDIKGTAQSNHYSLNGWDIDVKNEEILFSNSDLGIVLDKVRLQVKDKNTLTKLGSWHLEKTDSSILILTDNPKKVSWNFRFFKNNIIVSASAKNAFITAIAPCPDNRFPARIANAIEGNIYANTIWPSKVDLVKGDPGWPFVSYNPEIPILPGTIKEANGVIKMEFGIPRQIYHINNDTFQFYCSVMNSDWSDIGNLVTADHSDVIVVKMNKQ